MRPLWFLCGLAVLCIPVAPEQPASRSAAPRSAAPPACSSSCATASTSSPAATDREVRAWLAGYAKAPFRNAGPDLETLLFHATVVRDALWRGVGGALPDAHLQFLNRELAITSATVGLRVVEPDGTERTWLNRTGVPFDEKSHLHAPSCEVSITLKRVGLHHIWARL